MEDATRTRTQPAAERQGVSPELILETASLSDVGQVRSENQDACGQARDAAGNLLLIVADGMGGHQGGSTASRLCVEAVCREFRESGAPLDERLRAALERANADVFETAARTPELEGMGTTGVALAFRPDGGGYVAWVGDSRAYLLRDGELQRITEDHSWVAEAVRMGAIQPEEAETHPRRSQLLRCVGANATIEVDVHPLEARPGDRFLLCSDGLWGEVAEADLAAVLGDGAPSSATRALVERANRHGGGDNITVQILSVRYAAAPAPAEAPPARAAQRSARLAWLGAAFVLLAGVVAGAAWYALEHGGGGFPERQARPAPEEPSAGLPFALPDLGPEPPGEIGSGPREPAGAAPGPGGPEDAPAPDLKASPDASVPEQAVAAAPPAPAPTAPPLRPRVERFLEAWSRAVTTGDYALYESIGLPASREDFEREYGGRTGVLMHFELLEQQAAPDGTVLIRARMSYGYDAPAGRKQLDTEYRIRLRDTPAGLRYAGAWN